MNTIGIYWILVIQSFRQTFPHILNNSDAMSSFKTTGMCAFFMYIFPFPL